ncbi:MAG: DUF262 domain-containing protein [Fimbriimonadaceae bacterium]|nr:DUF262 domain-containing protein [Fimbriimonadaceae bacterium]
MSVVLEPALSGGDIELELGSGEVEAEDLSPAEITDPFDPRQIRMTVRQPTVQLLLTRLREGEVELDPDWQRHAGIWKDQQQSRLVESLLMKIPIPAFYFDEPEFDGHWVVIDGLQRLTSLQRFMLETPGLRLTGLEFLKDLTGHCYSDLSRSLQRRLLETELTVVVIEAGTPSAVKFNVFRRLNTGGMPLTLQEIRHALYPGPVAALLRGLADSGEFVTATDGAVKPARMADRECVLRFLAFCLHPYEDYDREELGELLTESMRQLNAMSDLEREELGRRFRRSMQAASQIVGRHVFRKYFGPDQPRHPVNKALFESWAVALDRRTDSELQALAAHQEQVLAGYAQLCCDQEFAAAISGSTGDVRKVKLRFGKIEAMLQELVP